MTGLALGLVAAGAGIAIYAYLGYPAVLVALSRAGRTRRAAAPPARWPSISVVIPVYNGAAVIAETLEAVLALDYPRDRRRIVVLSDGSTDGTDAIVAGFAARGVELIRSPERRGKTAAENGARGRLAGEIVINTDASVRVHPQAARRLVAALADPTVGVASGRDVSVSPGAAAANAGESAYVGYEMWVRDLETAVDGLVGASGCLYAVRAELHRAAVPDGLSTDFAAVLHARERGFRAVSVPQALCFVPRGVSLRQEYRRKVRTMARGLATLAWKRALLDPFRYGVFAWMLASHKLARWLVPWGAAAALAGLALLPGHAWWVAAARTAAAGLAGLAVAGWLWPEDRRMPRAIAAAAYGVFGLVAGLHAWGRVLTGRLTPVWEPTRRESTSRSRAAA